MRLKFRYHLKKELKQQTIFHLPNWERKVKRKFVRTSNFRARRSTSGSLRNTMDAPGQNWRAKRAETCFRFSSCKQWVIGAQPEIGTCAADRAANAIKGF